jgi:hypothetical protein
VRNGVIERLVENWLINSGERDYEVPFAQLLTAEGYRVIQRNDLPGILWRRPEMIPYLTLLFPHRLTGAFAKAIDEVSHNPQN